MSINNDTETQVELIYTWISYSLNACGFRANLFMAFESRGLAAAESRNVAPNHDAANALNSWLFFEANKIVSTESERKIKTSQDQSHGLHINQGSQMLLNDQRFVDQIDSIANQ